MHALAARLQANHIPHLRIHTSFCHFLKLSGVGIWRPLWGQSFGPQSEAWPGQLRLIRHGADEDRKNWKHTPRSPVIRIT